MKSKPSSDENRRKRLHVLNHNYNLGKIKSAIHMVEQVYNSGSCTNFALARLSLVLNDLRAAYDEIYTFRVDEGKEVRIGHNHGERNRVSTPISREAGSKLGE